MNQKEKTIRDLDPRDIKLSSVAKFFGGIWTIAVFIGLVCFGFTLCVAITGGYSYDPDEVLIGSGCFVGVLICGAELKYKFIKPAIQKIFS